MALASLESSSLPIIDAGAPAGPIQRERVAFEMHRALRRSGFVYVRGHGVDPRLVERAFAVAREFFEQPASFKSRFGYTDVASNFGYHGVEGESLDPKTAPDLKEAFTMRGALLGADHARFPSETFAATAREFFDATFASARRLLGLLAASLELPEDFFVSRHGGENVTLRFLHYPRNLNARTQSQIGAGAHTDYGSITLLFQDDVGGLELRDASDAWQDAPPIPGAIVVNAGDLMERWTNGRYRSTLHRVKRITGAADRYAIAMFVDPDSDVLVQCLPSCRSASEPARFPPITAGEHVRQKLAASHTLT